MPVTGKKRSRRQRKNKADKQRKSVDEDSKRAVITALDMPELMDEDKDPNVDIAMDSWPQLPSPKETQEVRLHDQESVQEKRPLPMRSGKQRQRKKLRGYLRWCCGARRCGARCSPSSVNEA